MNRGEDAIPKTASCAIRRGLSVIALVVALALGLAACSAGSRPALTATASSDASASADASSTPDASSTADASSTPGPAEVAGPPVASLGGGPGGAVPGELGTFLWDGLGSDAPWIVPPDAVPIVAGTPLAVTLDSALVPLRWTERWAPVLAGSAGDPAAVLTGGDGAIEVAAPVPPGAWGLQVEITFAEGRRAAWYWSVDVAP